MPRYYLDERLSPVIAALCRERHGLDVLSTEEVGRKGTSDEAQLAFSAAEGRCIVTQDRGDYYRFTRVFFEEGRPHAGVLCVPRSFSLGDFASIAAAIARYDRKHPAGLSPYTVDWLVKGA